VRFARGRRGGEPLRSSTRFFCLAALLVAAVVAAAGTSSATAARPGAAGLPLPGAPPTPALEIESPAPGEARRLTVQLTAYSASVEEGTAWGITRSGVPARLGTVAVDPSVIPLGSRLRIAGLPGIYRAEDTGGGIRGAHVDVFMESRAAALEFGRRAGVPVEVLDQS
jgi:3D (Asp-Asp-Asp) domain-containing protein